MRKLWIIFLLALSCLGASAQERIALLDRAAGKRVSFDYTYSLIQNGVEGDTVSTGQVLVQDNAYRLDALGLELWSDGTTRWTLDRSAKELLIEPVAEGDILTNPALLVLDYREHPGLLKVRSQGTDFIDVELRLDEGMVAHIVLRGITFNEEGPLSDFVLEQASLDKDYVVTDLR